MTTKKELLNKIAKLKQLNEYLMYYHIDILDNTSAMSVNQYDCKGKEIGFYMICFPAKKYRPKAPKKQIMIGFQVSKDSFIDLGEIIFKCPYCRKKYSDEKEKYLNRINKNKNFITKVKCSCGEVFGLTSNYKGDLVSFVNKF